MAAFTSSRGCFILPLDVVRLIVNEVDYQALFWGPHFRSKSLCYLSYISKAFYFAAQHQLFSSLSLCLQDPQITAKRVAWLTQNLQKNPALIKCIRSIYLTVAGPIQIYSGNQGHEIEAAAGSLLNDFLSLVFRSGFLQHLSIEYYYQEQHDRDLMARVPFHWRRLCTLLGTTTIVDEINASLSLESVRFIGIVEIPARLLLSEFKSSSLRKLVFINSLFDIPSSDEIATWDISSETLNRVAELTMMGPSTVRSVSVIQQCLSRRTKRIVAPPLQRLHTLRMSTPLLLGALSDFQDFLLSVADTLETLELRTETRHIRVMFSKVLTKLKRLKTFEMCTEIHATDSLSAGHLVPITKYLQRVSTLPRLTAIHIGIYVGILSPGLMTLDIVHGSEWSSLDEELSAQQSNFPALQHVSLQIEAYRRFDEDPAYVEGTRIQETYAPLSSILPMTSYQRPTLKTDFRASTVYSSELMKSLVNRSF